MLTCHMPARAELCNKSSTMVVWVKLEKDILPKVDVVLSPLLLVGVVPHHPVDPQQVPIQVSHCTRGLDNKGGTFWGQKDGYEQSLCQGGQLTENQVKIYQEMQQAALISCRCCPWKYYECWWQMPGFDNHRGFGVKSNFPAFYYQIFLSCLHLHRRVG